MHSVRGALALVALVGLVAPASAHGDLTLHEFDVLAISDFEGHEDSFPWEGFEIWDVYVGDGYNSQYDSDGVYFKANFAGDGTQRPTGSAAWTIDVSFSVDGQTFQRTASHDGSGLGSDFEALEWTIADGNVLQIKAWVPVANATGKAVGGIVFVSTVDGERRDVAPGGIYAPGSETEIPVQAPATPIFPALGQGRILDPVPITGPAKFIEATVSSRGGGAFDISVKNPLAQQGQHIFLRALDADGWRMNATKTMVELAGAASGSFQLTLAPAVTAGLVEPFAIDLYSDIGGRRMFYAYLEGDQVMLVEDAALSHSTTRAEAQRETPSVPLALLGVAVLIGVAARRRS